MGFPEPLLGPASSLAQYLIIKDFHKPAGNGDDFLRAFLPSLFWELRKPLDSHHQEL